VDTLVWKVPGKFANTIFKQGILRATRAAFAVFVVGKKSIQALRAEPVIIYSVIVTDNAKRRKDKILQPL